jgi:putative transposase
MRIDQKTMSETLRRVFMRLHYPVEIILICVRWYVAYPLSLRQLEEMMTERGVAVDHSTIHRWAIKMLPVLTAVCRRRKRPVGRSWRMDETYIKVAGQWKYLYRAVDKHGATVDFLLRAKRDHAAARAFFERAIGLHDVPEKIAIDKSGSNKAAIVSMQADSGLAITMRQSKYLNNIVEQDHRAIKRITRPMLGFKTFRCARIIIAGIETMHMIRKGQLGNIKDQASSAANQFYSLAF